MAPAFFDTHCHLQDPRFGDDLDGVLARARRAGVTHTVCCGTREADWGDVLELSRRYEEVIPMLGLHPWFVREASPEWLDRLAALVQKEGVGIGECGLDFALEDADRALQESVFRSQLRLARAWNRPVSIHCRRAWERLAALAREEGLPQAGAVVHAFSGSAEVARELQGLDFHLAFGCSLANPENSRGAKAVRTVSEDRLLFETDSPDMPPHQRPDPADEQTNCSPFSSAPSAVQLSGGAGPILNEPANIRLALEAAARLRGTDLQSLAALAYQNSERIFGGRRP